jgi:DNA-binding Lrp family transcriptional regulator
MRELDAQDQRLLTELVDDARLPVAELGRRIGLSRTATLARMRSLESAGVIQGYHADVAHPGHQPSHNARIGLVISTRDVPAYVRRLDATLGGELREVESVAGEYDLLVGVAVATASRLDEILNTIAGWRETVRTTTFVVLARLHARPGL